MVLERDVARIHNRRYGFPRLESVDGSSASEHYVFVPETGTSYTLSLLFPDAEITPVGARTYKVRPRRLPSRPPDDPMSRAVTALEVDHHPSLALILLDSIISRDRAHYRALWYRARALETLNRKAEATRAWRTVISEAEQNGWMEGLAEARMRLSVLLCSPWTDREKTEIRSSRASAIIQWFRCL
jgi:hypothetical protein